MTATGVRHTQPEVYGLGCEDISQLGRNPAFWSCVADAAVRGLITIRAGALSEDTFSASRADLVAFDPTPLTYETAVSGLRVVAATLSRVMWWWW